MRVRIDASGQTIPPKPRWSTKLAHPTYVIEPCPRCTFPEADGGYCAECGWSAPLVRRKAN